MVVQEPLKVAVWHALNAYCYKDAIFLAERLYAEVSSEEVLHLLATCYFRSGHTNRAYGLLKKNSYANIQTRYLFAWICFQLEKLNEAENALLGNHNKSILSASNEFGALSGAALQLLGKIYRKTGQSSKAAECFRESLRCNPYLWHSFEQLCQTGEKIDPVDYFKTTSSAKATQPSIIKNSEFSPFDLISNYKNVYSENLDPAKSGPLFTSTVVSKPTLQEHLSTVNYEWNDGDSDMPPPQSIALKKSRVPVKARQRIIGTKTSDSPVTPNFGVLPTDSPVVELGSSPNFITPPISNFNENPLKAPLKAPHRQTTVKINGSRHSSLGFSSFGSPSPISQLAVTTNCTSLRRSNRLFDSSAKDIKKTPRVRFADSNKPITTARKTKSRLTHVSQPLTPTIQNIQSAAKNENLINEIKDEKPTSISLSPIQQNSDIWMRLFQDLGKAYHALSIYDSKKAVDYFSSLPLNHQTTSWVMEQLGLAYYEMGEITAAEKVFEKVRENDPDYISDGMAVYSSLLWLSRKDCELSCLAQSLVDSNKNSAVSWCAMANCFSLQKEHNTAIKFLHRAVQLEPEFSYAYTLLGHEYVFIEDFDKGISCFRTALHYNEKHYNAWYGIGMIYYKQDNFSMAKLHFQLALKINPRNSVLLGHLAVTQHELGETDLAMDTINKAIEYNSKNALCKYHRARFYFDSERLQEALEELIEVKKLAPKDSLIYYMIGKVYQKRNEIILAQQNFSWAMSLNPHGPNNMIKEAMNQLQNYSREDILTSNVADSMEDDNGMSDISNSNL
ncbi:cell division cycle protein 27 homolog isoform X2 [Hydra vulgaris]|uniref:Cell division cycle protein 27 homolog n=1 Tax=Hydra vulgaris TaxID=6087 RepID=A0ABM4C2Q8_HYDVU